MTEQLSMFAPAKHLNRVVRPDGIRRLLEHKVGPFAEVLEGRLTGRQFRIAELHDGNILRIYLDGSRGECSPAMTTVLIDHAIRGGMFVEVPGV